MTEDESEQGRRAVRQSASLETAEGAGLAEKGPIATQMLDGARPEGILRAAVLLRQGGVVVVPTDTIYGLAASVLRPEAVQRVFAIKGRQETAAVPVLLATGADLPMLTTDVPRVAWRLIEAFWPGPLTLVLPARQSVDSVIRAGGPTVAVRVPSNRVCLQLLQSLGEPIVGTSANRSGHPTPAAGVEVVAQLRHEPDAVLLDDAHVGGGAPSTVVEMRGDLAVVHRVGALSMEDIRKAALTRTVAADVLSQLTETR